jgi:hypothetical protein
MSESFIPLVPASAGSREAAFSALHLNGLTTRSASSAAQASGAGGSAHEACGKPVVTLKRNGAVVSGIHIECACGQVVDLACVY